MEQTFKWKIEGVTPLIMDWDNLDGADAIQAWLAIPENKKTSKAGDERTIPGQWKYKLYNDGEHVALPEDVIRACLMRGAAKVPVGTGKKTFKSQSQSGLIFMTPHFSFKSDGKKIKMADVNAINGGYLKEKEAVKKLGFELFTKRARPNANTKHVKVRPMFKKWECSGECIAIDEQVTESVLQTIFEQAGKFVGIGNWRPSNGSPGPYGRFTAEIQG